MKLQNNCHSFVSYMINMFLLSVEWSRIITYDPILNVRNVSGGMISYVNLITVSKYGIHTYLAHQGDVNSLQFIDWFVITKISHCSVVYQACHTLYFVPSINGTIINDPYISVPSQIGLN